MTIATLVGSIVKLINIAIPILLGIAVLGLFFGIAKYSFSFGSEESRKSAKDIMIWGVVALFFMVSIWGILTLLQNTFLL
ncbi:hypothetical protein COU17_03420 [Candidatus Kaiserbacteria bacterium CG10_big_fil_rev_8_21_14_0_10_49_17]|uniref:Uncharacterized protein n=1 Tax=Candidatus Kaiserbacteria bacterium CG10_big_fil_rev_8_21_14_0_10_49_17 TaxID=1974609 RepID=A0A2M6WDJ8_9BACT|nr:MAG: hypothetical protein COU17_03420 [Candidatus Kaiserbacteria bacterium CG10_big_fil_rev_8_21_14_0_10_49_17]